MASSASSAAQQAAAVVIPRRAETVVKEVWSPSELHALDPGCNTLSVSLPPLAVPPAKAYALRFSLLTAPFETLHAKWRPKGATDDTEAAKLDSVDSARFQVIRATWESRDARNSEGAVAEQCKKGFWFRFTTNVDTRTFVVERSPSHLLNFISAIQYSFPHLVVPSDPEPSLSLACLLCDFFTVNATALWAYLPAQYFFLETQEKVAMSFFSTLENEIKARRNHEATLLDSLRQKTSKGWFSWGSSSKSKAKGKSPTEGDETNALAETISFIDSNSGSIPSAVKSAYLLSLTRKDRLSKLLEKASALQDAFAQDTGALESIAAAVSVSPQTNEPVPGWFGPDDTAAVADAKQSAVEMRQTCGLLQQLVFTASTLKSQVGGPVFSALVDVCEKAVIVAGSLEQYVDSYLAMKRSSVENGPILTGKAPLVKGSAASSSPGLLRQVSELHQSYESVLTTWEQQMPQQISLVDRQISTLERKVCSFFFAAVSAQLEGLDERHHTQLVELAARKPVQSASTTAEGDKVQTVLALFCPPAQPRPDDIVNIM